MRFARSPVLLFSTYLTVGIVIVALHQVQIRARETAEEVMRCIAKGEKQSEAMSHAFSLLLIETLDAIRHKAGIVYSVD